MEVAKIKLQLLQRRDELLRRVLQLTGDVHHRSEPLPADFAEQAMELENLDVLFELDAKGRQELARVNNALMRLETDEYDTCARCGNTISEARLKAIPYTDVCVECVRTQETGATPR